MIGRARFTARSVGTCSAIPTASDERAEHRAECVGRDGVGAAGQRRWRIPRPGETPSKPSEPVVPVGPEPVESTIGFAATRSHERATSTASRCPYFSTLGRKLAAMVSA